MEIIKDVFSLVWQKGSLTPKRFVYAVLENGKKIALDKTKVLDFIGGKNITDKKIKKLIGQALKDFEWKGGDFSEY